MFKRKGKLLALFLLATTLTFTGCSNDNTTEDAPAAVEDVNKDEEKQEDKKEEEKEDKEDKEEKEDVEEKEDKKEDSNELKIGETIKFKRANVTLTDLTIVDARDGKKALKYTYDFENTSDDSKMPMAAVSFNAFQDKVEVSEVYILDSSVVDTEKTIKTVQAGGKLEGIEYYVGIDDMDKPLEFQVSPAMSFNDKETYTMTIDLSSLK